MYPLLLFHRPAKSGEMTTGEERTGPSQTGKSRNKMQAARKDRHVSMAEGPYNIQFYVNLRVLQIIFDQTIYSGWARSLIPWMMLTPPKIPQNRSRTASPPNMKPLTWNP